MSLTPRLTLIGLYNYNHAIFQNLSLPATVDEEIFIDSLLMEYGECPLIYPNYDYMVLAIGAWCRKWYDNIERIAAAIKQEYNPLHNYDRTETWTENEEGTKDFTRGIVDGESATENQTINESATENQTINESGTENTTESENGNDENLVSAYNENDYQPSTKTTYERENERETTYERENERETETEKTTTANKANRNDRSTDETYGETNGKQNTKSGRTFGNIGVTTSTEMLQQELDLRRTENLYHIIAELFYKEFCLYVF